MVGWLDTRKFDETGDAAASQGWAPLVLDTNGNGKLDKWTEPDQPLDPQLDTRIAGGFYAVMPNPADGSVWGSVAFRYPGALVRFDPRTLLTEIYYAAAAWLWRARRRHRPQRRRVGVAGQRAPRRVRSTQMQGPAEWTESDRRALPGRLAFPPPARPELRRVMSGSASNRATTPGSISTTRSAWVRTRRWRPAICSTACTRWSNGKFVTLRIPYPLGFYTKGFEGRIDDAKAGWKGRGLWVPSGDRTPWHKEGGKGTKPLVVHFQMRRHPLEK